MTVAIVQKDATQNSLTDLFGEIIYEYNILDSIEDGYHVDASTGDFQSGTFQYVPGAKDGAIVVAMTREVYDLIERAVENKKHCNDFSGVWCDILWMGKAQKIVDNLKRGVNKWYGMKTIITGAGRKRLYTFKFTVEGVASNDNRPCLVVSLA